MAINNALLVAAPVLQNYLVDKDTGLPLANGIVSLYKDTARQTFKNWFYQTGIPGAYTYIELANPLRLSGAGTIQDPNGNDVIPFYYPYNETNENLSESYYVTVDSADENGDPSVRQFTRENFPFLPPNPSPQSTNPTYRNYLINNVFWRNVGSQNLTSVTDLVIAPSQHDGYTNGDIRFRKNITGANDSISFLPMFDSLKNDITPEYYINFKCTSVQLGETLKCIQIPISLHVKTLQNVLASIVIQAQNVSGNINNYLDIYIYQFMGTGALTQPVLIPWGNNNGRIILNNNFEPYVITDTLPDATNLVAGSGGDDALFLIIQYPLASTFEINITKPQLYLSDKVPDNDFDTYDQINTVISSDRTGDVRTSINYQTGTCGGWIAMNDGTIGSAASGAVTRANSDTWPLYNLLWNTISDPYFQMIASNGSPVSRGISAYTDFTANNVINLPKALGRVFAGHTSTSGVNFSKYIISRSGNNLIINDTSPFYTGMQIMFGSSGTLPSPLLPTPTAYYAIVISSTVFQVASSVTNAINGTPIALTTDGTGIIFVTGSIASHPIGSYVGQETHAQTLAELYSHTHGPGTFIATIPGTDAAQPNGATSNVTYISKDVSANHNYSVTGTSSSTGGNTPFNVLQPTSYVNYLIKL